jgi:ubiquitin C-terminal hydrolase
VLTILNCNGVTGASATACQLQSLLHRHLQPETLDAENKWQCSGCQEKVCATKTPEYQQLPTAVMVHLKRFRYDPVSAAQRIIL